MSVHSKTQVCTCSKILSLWVSHLTRFRIRINKTGWVIYLSNSNNQINLSSPLCHLFSSWIWSSRTQPHLTTPQTWINSSNFSFSNSKFNSNSNNSSINSNNNTNSSRSSNLTITHISNIKHIRWCNHHCNTTIIITLILVIMVLSSRIIIVEWTVTIITIIIIAINKLNNSSNYNTHCWITRC